MLAKSQNLKEESKEKIPETERIKTAAELLNNIQLEECDRTIMTLQLQIRQLEETNAELAEKLSEKLNLQKTKHDQSRDVQIQVNLSQIGFFILR